jgi:NTE family protein
MQLTPVKQQPFQANVSVVNKTGHPKIAFVLGGGAARGFAHIGALKTLSEQGIEADIVVGTSSGSVVGALYAAGIRGQALIDAAEQINIWDLADWSFPDRGVIKGERLQQYVNKQVHNKKIESLPIQFVAVATDLQTGELVGFNHGDTGMAVRASSAIPGFVQPVRIRNRDYIDGGVVSQVPIKVARKYGADIIIAVDVSKKVAVAGAISSTVDVLVRSLSIMSQRMTEYELVGADVVIQPKVNDFRFDDFNSRDLLLKLGRSAALKAMPEIRSQMQKVSNLKQ